ncbi:hypothetical protein BV25DRAFT_1795158 [Artomyces pyxidatus]|uniref:Uncharacterized protein n=1 Tax=Artomyces pyxidatus TaxID=48021 RepID=A0ACB8TFS4_9AGAM|nr:hypothetical protein BV25DRAFT_1795158 [Artomyces pyxidatus]
MSETHDAPVPYSEIPDGDALPEYSNQSATAIPTPTVSPTISPTSISLQHTYSLRNNSGRIWLSLLFRSRAQDIKHMPLFFDRDTLTGEVHLDLDKAETLKGLTIGITAATTAVGQEEEQFLDVLEPVWTPGGSATSEKLKGKYTWPFSIRLPVDTSVSLTPKSTPQRYPLPPTFSERASPAYIDYKLVATVRRGGLRVNNKLSTSFVYLPRSIADPPSLMRTIAYQQNTPLLGPKEDPPGWKVYPEVTIQGKLFDARSVSVFCTVRIQDQLTYASNSPMPLSLTLRGTDAQALDLLAKAPAVYLRRVVAIGSEATDESVARRSNNTFISTVAKAVFWADQTAGAGEEGAPTLAKTLQGELFVPKGMKPTFSFPRFAVKYELVMLAPQIPGFVPTNASEPILFERITVTLAGAPGVVARSHVPPGYVAPVEADYNVATGFLENGNQRFVHHHGGSWA